jgi:hypothetical protein
LTSFLIAPLVAAIIVALGTGVLVRRDRRRMAPGADALLIEPQTSRGLRETRRRAC